MTDKKTTFFIEILDLNLWDLRVLIGKDFVPHCM